MVSWGCCHGWFGVTSHFVCYFWGLGCSYIFFFFFFSLALLHRGFVLVYTGYDLCVYGCTYVWSVFLFVGGLWCSGFATKLGPRNPWENFYLVVVVVQACPYHCVTVLVILHPIM